MADEKVNMGPEENKAQETLSPPGQGELPPLEENNTPAVSGEDKAAPDHVEPDPPSADRHTQQTVFPGMGDLFHPYQLLLSSCHSSDFQIGKSKSPLASGGCLCYHKGKL